MCGEWLLLVVLLYSPRCTLFLPVVVEVDVVVVVVVIVVGIDAVRCKLWVVNAAHTGSPSLSSSFGRRGRKVACT